MDEPREAAATDDLSRAQEALARALGRARIGEDRALANQVRELGGRLARLLSGLLRMTRLHSPDNKAFDKPVEDLHAALLRLTELLGSVHLVAVEDQVYVNDIRIRAGEKASSIQDLGAELRRHNAGGRTFHAPLEGAAIRALIGALGGAADAEVSTRQDFVSRASPPRTRPSRTSPRGGSRTRCRCGGSSRSCSSATPGPRSSGRSPLAPRPAPCTSCGSPSCRSAPTPRARCCGSRTGGCCARPHPPAPPRRSDTPSPAAFAPGRVARSPGPSPRDLRGGERVQLLRALP